HAGRCGPSTPLAARSANARGILAPRRRAGGPSSTSTPTVREPWRARPLVAIRLAKPPPALSHEPVITPPCLLELSASAQRHHAPPVDHGVRRDSACLGRTAPSTAGFAAAFGCPSRCARLWRPSARAQSDLRAGADEH